MHVVTWSLGKGMCIAVALEKACANSRYGIPEKKEILSNILISILIFY